jgi:hypothetical protein
MSKAKSAEKVIQEIRRFLSSPFGPVFLCLPRESLGLLQPH